MSSQNTYQVERYLRFINPYTVEVKWKGHEETSQERVYNKANRSSWSKFVRDIGVKAHNALCDDLHVRLCGEAEANMKKIKSTKRKREEEEEKKDEGTDKTGGVVLLLSLANDSLQQASLSCDVSKTVLVFIRFPVF